MELAPSLRAFFHQAVTRAIANQHLETSEAATYYLVDLLAGFAQAPLPDRPLALAICEGLQGSPGERLQKLKEVGDTSLFVSGCFPDSLNASLVDVDYYIGIGEVAYGSLGRMVGPAGRSTSFGQVFAELAQKFASFVDVLAEVSTAETQSPSALLRLYEKYLRTRSEAIAGKLRSRGFLVKPGMIH